MAVVVGVGVGVEPEEEVDHLEGVVGAGEGLKREIEMITQESDL